MVNLNFVSLKSKLVSLKLDMLISDESGQSSAELILLIGGMIVIVLIAMSFYKSYILSIGDEISSNELNNINKSIESINSKF
ncbi:class III signal peptide-containing protein [Methanobrevibacter arboriphilus]|nr:class III signal peptide-containing protein [Methanobrevibacter arboriphilus]